MTFLSLGKSQEGIGKESWKGYIRRGVWDIINLHIRLFGMEGIDRALHINLRKLSPHLSLPPSNTFYTFPYIVTGTGYSHSQLHSSSKDQTVPRPQSHSWMVHGPLHFLRKTIGRNRAIMRGSCSPNPQQGIPKGTVNYKSSSSFPILFLHEHVIIQGSTLTCNF